jgi:hypothetical protein
LPTRIGQGGRGGGQRIRRITPDGVIHTVAGSGRKGYTGDGGPALGVCLGAQSVFASPTGLDYRPTLTARRAWRIG